MPTLPVCPLRRLHEMNFDKPVVADFDDPLVDENVARLQIAVHDAVIVQIGHAGGNAVNPGQGFRYAATRRDAGRALLPANGPHINSMTTQLSPWSSCSHVVQREQIRMLKIQALGDAAQFDIPIAANQFQRHFFAGVAGGVIHFAKAAVADAALDGVACQRP